MAQLPGGRLRRSQKGGAGGMRFGGLRAHGSASTTASACNRTGDRHYLVLTAAAACVGAAGAFPGCWRGRSDPISEVPQRCCHSSLLFSTNAPREPPQPRLVSPQPAYPAPSGPRVALAPARGLDSAVRIRRLTRWASSRRYTEPHCNPLCPLEPATNHCRYVFLSHAPRDRPGAPGWP